MNQDNPKYDSLSQALEGSLPQAGALRIGAYWMTDAYQYLQSMPDSRASAEEILHALRVYGGLEFLWERLLGSLRHWLTPEERDDCQKKYEDLFVPEQNDDCWEILENPPILMNPWGAWGEEPEAEERPDDRDSRDSLNLLNPWGVWGEELEEEGLPENPDPIDTPDSLEEAAELWIDELLSDDEFEAYVQAMPDSRASAEEIMEVLTSYDGVELLWNRLLGDFGHWLTETERPRLLAAYCRIFGTDSLEAVDNPDE